MMARRASRGPGWGLGKVPLLGNPAGGQLVYGAPKRYGAPTRPVEHPLRTRSLVNTQAGEWTREMEENFRQHARFLGYPVKPFEWPDGEVW